MNNIEQLFNESADIKQFIKGYYKYLFTILNSIDVNEIAAFAEELVKTRNEGNTIFFIGNGGSAATASHMVNDFGMDVLKKSGSDVPFRAMSLTDNAAVMLAIGNDDGYDKLFVNQLRIHYRSGDILVAISASGNSPNIVDAAEWVKKQGGKVIALVGFDGGRLKRISDVVIHAKSEKGEYGPVEDAHMIMDHLLANWLQYYIQNELHRESK
jgi:D-sedoheptulose 7-phosphate isomerase